MYYIMKYKEFGNSGIKNSVIGMGTYYDPLWIVTARFGWLRDSEKKIQSLRAGLDAGINIIDTAELYGSEPLVKKAMEGYERDKIFISTKVWPTHLKREKLFKSLEKSLKRLGTGYVDLYLIHFPGSKDSNREALLAMEEALESGLIKFIGLSNFNLKDIVEARKTLRKNDITAIQNQYNLKHREPEKDLLPYCEKEKIAFMAYYPLAHGKLTEDKNIIEVSKKLKITPAQLSILWLLRWSSVFPIPRASRPEHVIENAKAAEIEIPTEILEKI